MTCVEGGKGEGVIWNGTGGGGWKKGEIAFF